MFTFPPLGLTSGLTADLSSLQVAVKIILVKQHITSEVTSVKLRMFTKVRIFMAPRQSASHICAQRARRETKVWRRTHHENIVPFLGITTDYSCPFAAPNPVAMISLWMDGGDLMNALNTGLTELKRLHLVRTARQVGYLWLIKSVKALRGRKRSRTLCVCSVLVLASIPNVVTSEQCILLISSMETYIRYLSPL